MEIKNYFIFFLLNRWDKHINVYLYVYKIWTSLLTDASLMVRIKDSMKADSLLKGLDPNGLDKGWVYGQALSTVAFLAKSLSDENRLRVLISLSNGRRSVSSLVEDLKLSQPLVSHHLKELKRSLLLKVERNGPFIYYELADPSILTIIKDLETLAGDLLANRRSF